jgi:hypothetical protein
MECPLPLKFVIVFQNISPSAKKDRYSFVQSWRFLEYHEMCSYLQNNYTFSSARSRNNSVSMQRHLRLLRGHQLSCCSAERPSSRETLHKDIYRIRSSRIFSHSELVRRRVFLNDRAGCPFCFALNSANASLKDSVCTLTLSLTYRY